MSVIAPVIVIHTELWKVKERLKEVSLKCEHELSFSFSAKSFWWIALCQNNALKHEENCQSKSKWV